MLWNVIVRVWLSNNSYKRNHEMKVHMISTADRQTYDKLQILRRKQYDVLMCIQRRNCD